jgi:hypothetical protein
MKFFSHTNLVSNAYIYHVIIFDYKFYDYNEKEVVDWLNAFTPGWCRIGLVLTFKTEQDRLLFLLRWA